MQFYAKCASWRIFKVCIFMNFYIFAYPPPAEGATTFPAQVECHGSSSKHPVKYGRPRSRLCASVAVAPAVFPYCKQANALQTDTKHNIHNTSAATVGVHEWGDQCTHRL